MRHLMKLASSGILLHLRSGYGSRNVLGNIFYSTMAATSPSNSNSGDSLYRRISPVGDNRVSIVPVLDQWVQEGREAGKAQLLAIIKEMRYFRRYKHALEISQWMSDKRYFPLSYRDIAVRLDLISKVHGIEQAENYFHNIPKQSKVLEVYSALLNCYAQEKCVEKAEAVMQKVREVGLSRTTLCYNVLLNLFYQTGNYEKLDFLVHEMEVNSIPYDKFTFTIRLSACAAMSNTEETDNIITRMESDTSILLDWSTYVAAASAYTRAGLVDKALKMLKKSEALILGAKRRSIAFNALLTQYAAIGEKDEVLRLWELYKKMHKIYNKGYKNMIISLLKLDDIEGAEKIFEEWDASQVCYDFQIADLLINAYSRKGLMVKAEDLVDRALVKGGKPSGRTWYFLARGYVRNNQLPKAVEAMKVAISMQLPGWKPGKESLAACLEYLKGNGDPEEAKEFLGLLERMGTISTDIHDRLSNYIEDRIKLDVPSLREGDFLAGDGEIPEILKQKQDVVLDQVHQILEPHVNGSRKEPGKASADKILGNC
ncbi:pentatricopeptide repeat-containing protein At2g20710, mitochondrial-like [Malania oleifera]|uniref:pentatricopeptide repeat-containing protein At2g20710, mitochondrial-like n=1 Tax=Malania oleifera TaxID=397392 RepID=UPI0025AE61DB|nr:pentatricopeptide repeat-containing protein At2g20710, mitochondrial-like [Malania oleifera]